MSRPSSSSVFFIEDKALAHYLSRISKHRTLTTEEEVAVAIRIRNGDREALETLIKSNLRFVVSVCRNYQNQGLPLPDLINEGNLGLIRAATRFDERKNFKFISYAVWWIRQAVLQALADQSRIIKVPLNRVGTIHRIGKMHNQLEQRLSRSPTLHEIASELHMDVKEICDTIKIGNSHISLDSPIGNSHDDDFKLSDVFYDREQENADQPAVMVLLHNRIEHLLQNLSKREREVIKMYYGIEREIPQTLEEIGIRFNLTRERVRQIKEKALKKLKYVVRLKGMHLS